MLSRFIDICRLLLQKPVILFAIGASITGLLTVFITPPLASNDEISHIARINEISNGTILTKRIKSGNFGGTVPSSIKKLYMANDQKNGPRANLSNISSAKTIAAKQSINEKNNMAEISYSGSALYSPISYIFHVYMLLLAKLFGLPVLTSIYALRVVSLVIYTAIMALAIYIIPTKKWYLLAIGLLPMAIQQASAVSIDGPLIAFSALFIAIVLAQLYKQNPFNNYIALHVPLFISSLYIALSKPVFIPILFVLIFTANRIYKPRTNRWYQFITVMILVPLVISVAWNIAITKKDYHSGQRLSVNTIEIYPPEFTEGTQYLITHPVYAGELIFHTYISHQKSNDIPNYIASSFTGKFTEYAITPANWFIVSVIATLVLSFCLAEKGAKLLSQCQRLYVFCLLLIIATAITFSMYFYATSFKNPVINGVQGRYFIPLLPFLILLLGEKRWLTYINSSSSKLLLISIILINLLMHQYLLMSNFL